MANAMESGCGISGKNLVGLLLAEVQDSEAFTQLSLSFFHFSKVSEGDTASPLSWHGGNVNSFALYPGISDRRKSESAY